MEALCRCSNRAVVSDKEIRCPRISFFLRRSPVASLVQSWSKWETSRDCYSAWSCPPVSHLMFAHDTFLFSRVSTAQARILLDCLDKFSKWPSQVINFEKLGVVFLKKICVSGKGRGSFGFLTWLHWERMRDTWVTPYSFRGVRCETLDFWRTKSVQDLLVGSGGSCHMPRERLWCRLFSKASFYTQCRRFVYRQRCAMRSIESCNGSGGKVRQIKSILGHNRVGWDM